MKLCVNADDYGYTWGVTEGIIYTHLNGIVTSTTVLTNSDNLEEAYEKSKTCPNMGFGVHLTLTLGKPLTKGKTICDENGVFYNQIAVKQQPLDPQEVEDEFRAQIERFIEVFKRKPDHIDGHHGAHDMHHTVEVTKKLMAEYNLPARRISHMKFISEFYGPTVSVETILNILETNKEEEIIEIMTHPAYCDIKLRAMSSYNKQRIEELNVLCDPRILDYIKAHNIELVHY